MLVLARRTRGSACARRAAPAAGVGGGLQVRPGGAFSALSPCLDASDASQCRCPSRWRRCAGSDQSTQPSRSCSVFVAADQATMACSARTRRRRCWRAARSNARPVLRPLVLPAHPPAGLDDASLQAIVGGEQRRAFVGVIEFLAAHSRETGLQKKRPALILEQLQPAAGPRTARDRASCVSAWRRSSRRGDAASRACEVDVEPRGSVATRDEVQVGARRRALHAASSRRGPGWRSGSGAARIV